MYTSDFKEVSDWDGWTCERGLGCFLAPHPHALTVNVNDSDSSAYLEKTLGAGSHNVVTAGIKHNASSSIDVLLQVRKAGVWHDGGSVSVRPGREFHQIAFTQVRENPQLVGFTELRIFPAYGQSGVQVQFDYLSVHNDGYLYPRFFAFQTVGDSEGWGAANSDVTATATGSTLALEVTDGTGNAPAISYQGICIPAEDAPVMLLRFKASACGSQAKLWWRESDQYWDSSHRVAFYYNQSDDWQLVRIPLRDSPQWTGTVFGLKFEPNVNEPGCDMQIDYLAFADDRPGAMANKRSTFTAGADGWTACSSSSITIHPDAEGTAELKAAGQNYACMENTSLSADRAAQGLVDIRVRADRTAAASLYWQTSDSTPYDSEHRVSFLLRGSTDYQTKRLDLRTNPNFAGVGKLRLVVPKQTSSSVLVDWVVVHSNGDTDLGRQDYTPDSDGGKFRLLRSGEIQPNGWIKEAIKKDLTPGKGMAGSQHIIDWRTNFRAEQDYWQSGDTPVSVCYTWPGSPSSNPDWPTWGFCDVPYNYCYSAEQKRNRNHGYGAANQTCVIGAGEGKLSINWGTADFQSRWMAGLAQLAVLGDVSESPWTDAQALLTDWFENEEYGLLNVAEGGNYIGVYPSHLRWEKLGTGRMRSSAEMMVHVYALIGMLYRYEQDPAGRGDYLALAKAVTDEIMAHYNYASPYFKEAIVNVDYGAGSWGVQMVEAMAHLYRLTGNEKYREYALYVYQDYSRAEGIYIQDYRLSVLLDKGKSGQGFNDHGAHVGAFLKFPVWLARHVNDPRFRKEADIALATIQRHLSPGGGLVSNEHVRYRTGHPDLTTEFSGSLRTMESMFDSFRLSGRAELAELAERALFNSVIGAVDNEWEAASYFPRDNFTYACGEWPRIVGGRYRFNWDATQDHNSFTRFSPSPVVKDTSVDTPHILPVYVRSLWLRAEHEDPGFVLGSYGPSKIDTTFNGSSISIEESTSYPFLNPTSLEHVKLTFSGISSTQPATIWLRIPEWARDMTVTVNSGSNDQQMWEKEGFKLVHASWSNGDTVTIRFTTGVGRQRSFSSYDNFRSAFANTYKDANGASPSHAAEEYPAKYSISYGPLVFAVPLRHSATRHRTDPPGPTDPVPGYPFRQFLDTRFQDRCYVATESLRQQVGGDYAVVWDPDADLNDPWNSKPVRIDTQIRRIPSAENEQASMYPMGGEIMRVVGFESGF